MSYDVDPTARFQSLENPARDRNTPDRLDVSARDRLAVRDDGKRFQDGA